MSLDKLSDFKPLKRLTLPELGDLRCEGLVVVVGPNSSGKTQLLRDIVARISGEPRDLVVAAGLEVDVPNHDEFLRCLKAEGYISSYWDDNDEEQFVPRTTFVGTGQGVQNVGTNQLVQWKSKSATASKRKRRDDYLGWMAKFLVTVLFLENRLTALNPVPTIDFETQPPANDLHALHLNDEARAALATEVQRAFSKAVWSCAAKGNQVCLRVRDDGDVPSAEDRHSVRKMARFRTIESEGDGMKSYIYTVISLLLGRRPVTIIDEPELCLHPPQAYSLGQFVGRHATSKNMATFVATHSSQILRGMIQTAETLQIVRVTRSGVGFAARLVESKVLNEAMKKPTVRAETVLDGIFAQAVTIIEADGDRIVYQAAWEIAGTARNFDIHFATAGGTGSIADTTQLYRVLGIPISIVVDLDVLADPDKIERILRALDCDEIAISALRVAADTVAKAIIALPPTISESETRDRLTGLASDDLDWQKGHDRQLWTELSSIRNALNGMRDLKAAGVSSLSSPLREQVKDLVQELAGHGLFLVPVGELEGWLSDCGIKASKSTKWAWANEAAEYIRANPARTDDVWGFVGRVGDFLTAHFH